MNRREVLEYGGLLAAAGVAGLAWKQSGAKNGAVAGPLQPGGLAVNQVGFLPGAQKMATVLLRDPAGPADTAFQLEAEKTGKAVFHGKLGERIFDAASAYAVAQADFSDWKMPGLYRVVAQGRRSEPFRIGKDVYREPLRTAMRAFYGQRCGCAVDLGGGYSHAACHASGAFHPSSGRSGGLANHGGWHDAGDYGRYAVNSGLSTGTLLWAWEFYAEVLRNLPLGIPESGGKTPDFLAEVRWNLEWMLQMQDEDGGAWHKQTSEQFCLFLMPEKDTLTSFVIGTGNAPYKSTCATADLAAVMAIAARCYGEFDAAFSARCLGAARRAWAWAVAHPDVTFLNPRGVATGDYGDAHCGDEIFWASAELWRTTGEAEFERAFLSRVEELTPETAIATPGWSTVAPMAWWTYLLAERKGAANGDAWKARAQRRTAAEADMLVARRALSGYGNTLAIADYGWGSNGTAANQSLLLLVAHRLGANPAHAEAALGNLDYLLGRNCFGVSWVTQVGTRAFEHPHHRPSAADGILAPWPGLLSGGPNAQPDDPVARALPTQAPMRMWVDDERAYSLNEVAINWNAPLVFLLAGANAL